MSFRLALGESGAFSTVAVQSLGDLDSLLRCLEDEFKGFWDEASERGEHLFSSNMQKYLSELWVAKAFAVLFAIKDENGFTEAMKAVYRELRIIRVPLQKFEIARPDKKVPPSEVMEITDTDGALFAVNYDDLRKGEFGMGLGVTPRGSITWRVIDVDSRTERWIERRYLSDLMLEKC